MIKNTYAGNRTENVTGTPDPCKIHKNNSKSTKLIQEGQLAYTNTYHHRNQYKQNYTTHKETLYTQQVDQKSVTAKLIRSQHTALYKVMTDWLIDNTYLSGGGHGSLSVW